MKKKDFLPGYYEGYIIPHGPFLEEWKSIKELFYLYSISNYGRLKNNSNGFILKNSIEDGYCRISIHRKEFRKHLPIHRFVAIYFLRKPPGKDIVNHKRGFRNDNLFTQIEWCNHSENNMHSARVTKREFPSKESGRYLFSHNKKYISKNVLTGIVNEYFGEKELKENGFCQSAVSMCVNGKRKTHGGCTWSRERLKIKRFNKK